MEKKIILQLIENLINQSKKWKEDADNREEYNDWFYHHGQLDAFIKLKRMIERQ